MWSLSSSLSLRIYFKSLSLSWSLGVRSLSLSLSLRVRSLSLSWSLGVRSLSMSWSLGVSSLFLSWSLGVRSLLTSLTLTPSAADVGLLTCNSLADRPRPFMPIEFFSGLLPIPESVWSDIQDRPTNITLGLYIQQLLWLAF